MKDKSMIWLIVIIMFIFFKSDKSTIIVVAQEHYGDIKLVAHRGYCKNAPENTIQAYEAAANAGFRYIEMDARESADGKFYMMHDETVDRMTNGEGNISNMAANQIEQIQIDAGNRSEDNVIYNIPTLENALYVCEKYQIIPVLHVRDIKHITELLDICKMYSMYEQIIYMVDDPVPAKKIRKINPNALLWGIISDWQKMDQVMYHYSDIDGMGFNVNIKHINTDVVNAFASNKAMLAAWFVNSKDVVKEMDKLGVEYVVTDDVTNEDLLDVVLDSNKINCKVGKIRTIKISAEEYVDLKYELKQTDLAVIEGNRLVPKHCGECVMEVRATNKYTEYFKIYFINIKVNKGNNDFDIFLKNKIKKRINNQYIGEKPTRLIIKSAINTNYLFKSSDDSKLIVGSDGTLYPLKSGNVKVTIISEKTKDYNRTIKKIKVRIIDTEIVKVGGYYYKKGLLYKVVAINGDYIVARVQKKEKRKKSRKNIKLRGWECRVYN